MKAIIPLTIIFILSLVVVMEDQLIQHENVHKAIATEYGHKNTTIDLNYLKLSGVTHIHGVTSESEREMHSLNEIFNYQLQGLIYTMFICTFLICIGLLELKKNNKRE